MLNLKQGNAVYVVAKLNDIYLNTISMLLIKHFERVIEMCGVKSNKLKSTVERLQLLLCVRLPIVNLLHASLKVSTSLSYPLKQQSNIIELFGFKLKKSADYKNSVYDYVGEITENCLMWQFMTCIPQ